MRASGTRAAALTNAAVSGLNRPSHREVGEALGVGPSAVVPIVDELEALGALTREPDPNSRSRPILTLTRQGLIRRGRRVRGVTP